MLSALLPFVLLPVPSPRPLAVTTIDDQMVRTVVEHCRLAEAGRERLKVVSASKIFLPGWSLGQVGGDQYSLSPDGSTFALSAINKGRHAMLLIPLNGGAPRVVPSLNAIQLDWSRDSRHLAVLDLTQSGTTRTVVVSRDGTRGAAGLEGAYRVFWSRNGGQIVGARRLRDGRPIPFTELRTRTYREMDPLTEAVPCAAWNLASGEVEPLDDVAAARRVLGPVLAGDAGKAALGLWSIRLGAYQRASPSGVLFLGPVETPKRIYDFALSERGLSRVERLNVEEFGPMDARLLSPTLVGYATEGSLFPGLASLKVGGLTFATFDTETKKVRRWMLSQRRATRCVVEWSRPKG